MDTNQSTECITIVPADLYDEMMADTTEEHNEALQWAVERAREFVVHS